MNELGGRTLFDNVEGGSDSLSLTVNTRLYSEEALFRACYVFTDRCYMLLEDAGLDRVRIQFRKRRPTTDLETMAGEFANELVDQRVRADLARETRPIRELIVAQAFAEADLDASR